MVLINGSVSADKTAIRKLGQMTSYRQIGRQIAGRQIDRLTDRLIDSKQQNKKGEAL